MLRSTSPACTELETHVMDWLVGMLGLPEKFLSSKTGGGVIQDTASSAVLCALLAAREEATNYTSNKKGSTGKLVAYASTQTHSSLEKAAMIAGIGTENLRLIEVWLHTITPAALQAERSTVSNPAPAEMIAKRFAHRAIRSELPNQGSRSCDRGAI